MMRPRFDLIEAGGRISPNRRVKSRAGGRGVGIGGGGGGGRGSGGRFEVIGAERRCCG